MVHQGFLKDRKSNYGIVEEEQEFCLDREMCRGISKAQGVVETTPIRKVSLTWMHTSWYAMTHPGEA
jgi:hypothetical protein